MLSRFDKAWISGAVSFASLTLLKLFDLDINIAMQGSIVGLITMAMTFIVPNKT